MEQQITAIRQEDREYCMRLETVSQQARQLEGWLQERYDRVGKGLNIQNLTVKAKSESQSQPQSRHRPSMQRLADDVSDAPVDNPDGSPRYDSDIIVQAQLPAAVSVPAATDTDTSVEAQNHGDDNDDNRPSRKR
jgi:TolA-binding protein